tara:strand:- start:1091 stop:1909 length:819 start_codon:yes stop_codon:yes gene_type:complete
MFPNDTKHIKKMGDGIIPGRVSEGDKIYVVGECLDYFFKEIEPKIMNPFILVTGRSDISIDSWWEDRITNKIIKWFAVNNVSSNPKIQTIPLGIDNVNWRFDNNPQGNTKLFNDINSENIKAEKELLVSFQSHTNATERERCFNHFKEKDFITHRPYTNEDRRNEEFLKEYYREIRRHKFSVCPFGTGFDCHRIWQTLILNSFPIVMNHKSMEEFYDLPIWFVDDWCDVTKENIRDKYKEMVDKYNNGRYNMNKLWFDYWRDKINACIPIHN